MLDKIYNKMVKCIKNIKVALRINVLKNIQTFCKLEQLLF